MHTAGLRPSICEIAKIVILTKKMLIYLCCKSIIKLHICTIKQCKKMKRQTYLRKKQIECDVLENVVFTDLSIQLLRKTSIVVLSPLVEIVAHQNKLPVYYASSGVAISNKSWLHAMDHIENAVLNN